MKHLNAKKTIFTLSCLLALCLLLVGCGSSDAVNAVKEAVSEAANPAKGTVQTEEPAAIIAAPAGSEAALVPQDQVSCEELTAAFERMLQKGLIAVENNDYEAFRTVYVDADEEYLKAEWNGFKTVLSNHDKHIAQLLWHSDDQAVFGCTFYTVTGVHPNTRRTSNWYCLCMQMMDGQGYMFQPTQEELAILQTGSNEGMMELCFNALGNEADAARAARDAERNCAFFDEPWLMSRSDICFQGCNESPRVMMAWQEENGDVKVLLWTANGTSQNITDYNIRLQLEDQQLGTVFDYTLSDAIPVKSGHSVCRVITVPANHVRTGAAAWGSLRSHVTNNNQ